MTVQVYIETGSRRVFACAPDWPGWCRSAKDEQAAIETLVSYAPRYARVAKAAATAFELRDSDTVRIVDRVVGGATTDFGAPEKSIALDAKTLSTIQRAKHVALMQGAWRVFDGVVANAPPLLRKGPRGGGRDRDAIAEHVIGAEVAYARKLGVRVSVPEYEDTRGVTSLRGAIAEVVTSRRGPGPLVEKGWLTRYAVRRITWHVLDHAWEIEDRSS